jgi:hypothetical protein
VQGHATGEGSRGPLAVGTEALPLRKMVADLGRQWILDDGG